MDAAELWGMLEGAMDRNVPLHKCDVLVKIDGKWHMPDFEFSRDSDTGHLALIDTSLES